MILNSSRQAELDPKPSLPVCMTVLVVRGLDISEFYCKKTVSAEALVTSNW